MADENLSLTNTTDAIVEVNGNANAIANTNVNAGSDNSNVATSPEVEELKKQLAERDRKYEKLKSTMDVKLKELGDMTKRERERMTAEELERKEIEEIKAQNEMLLKEREVVNAERRFIQCGCDTGLATDGAKALIDKDYDALFDVIGKMLDNKAAFEKAELLRAIPKPQGGASKATMTKEQFNRLGYRERVELAEKDPEANKKFTT